MLQFNKKAKTPIDTVKKLSTQADSVLTLFKSTVKKLESINEQAEKEENSALAEVDSLNEKIRLCQELKARNTKTINNLNHIFLLEEEQ